MNKSLAARLAISYAVLHDVAPDRYPTLDAARLPLARAGVDTSDLLTSDAIVDAARSLLEYVDACAMASLAPRHAPVAITVGSAA